jgi:hypothetical protein
MTYSNEELKAVVSNFFPDLNNKAMDQFLSICKYKKAGNKEIILKGGSTRKNVILLLSGSARAFSLDKEGQELNNFMRYEGHLIADAKVFGDEVQILEVESIGEVNYLKFNIGELEELGFENSELLRFYLAFLKEIILTLSHRVGTFVTMSSKERYKDLLRWNPKYLETAFDKDVASFIGIKPITLYRIKKEG